ncbi:MAG: hypothetical protein ACR2QO_23860 [Acidimicrobiales bacterium]
MGASRESERQAPRTKPRTATAALGPERHISPTIAVRCRHTALGKPFAERHLTETEGLDQTIAHQVEAIATARPIDAVYSIGGANHATLDVYGRR